jgi:hypothetical protein
MRQPSDNSAPLEALIASKTEIDNDPDPPRCLSAEHFNCTSDEVTWADVGTLGSYLRQLP